MALYKRGNTWWMTFTFGGERVQRSTKCKNKRDAAVIEAALKTQLAKGEVGIEPPRTYPTFKKAMKDCLAFLKADKSVKPGTVTRYESGAKTLLKFFGETPVNKISVEAVGKFKVWLVTGKSERTGDVLQPATINYTLFLLKKLFRRLIETSVIVKNPTAGLKYLPVSNEQTRVLSAEEERVYLLACEADLKDLAIVLIETGARPSEILNLKREDVYLLENYIQIAKGKTKAARRRIPLSRRAGSVIRKVLRENAGEYVFPRKKLDHYEYFHKRAVTRSGIADCRLYDLRHSFASRHVENGTDLITLAALLGHTNLKMLMRYAHPSDGHKQQAIISLEKKQAKAG